MKFKIDLVKSHQDNLNEAVNENLVPDQETSVSKLVVGKQYYITYKVKNKGIANSVVVFNGFTLLDIRLTNREISKMEPYPQRDADHLANKDKPAEFSTIKEVKSKTGLTTVKELEASKLAMNVETSDLAGRSTKAANLIILNKGKWCVLGGMPITAIYTMKPSDMDNGI